MKGFSAFALLILVIAISAMQINADTPNATHEVEILNKTEAETLPGYDLVIPRKQIEPIKMQMQSHEDTIRVIVKIKEPEEIWQIKSKPVSDIRRSMKSFITQNLSDYKFFRSFNGFSAKLSRIEYDDLVSNGLVDIVPDKRMYVNLLTDNIKIINASKVWKIQVSGNNLTGAGQSICIVDTGVDYSHPDLGGCFGSSCKVVDGYDFVNQDSDPMDDVGHGTFIAGIAAADGEIKGVAPQARIIAAKVMDITGGWDTDILNGIEWCVGVADQYNIRVINMALGDQLNHTNYCDSTDIYNQAFSSAINSAVNNNIMVVISSGNDGSLIGINSPACIKNATPVGATTKFDAVDDYVNRNRLVQLMAPGSDIYSTLPASLYATGSGTSFSTPHVSGAVILLQQFAQLRGKQELTNNELKDILNRTGKRIYDSQSQLYFSRIDVYNAVQYLENKYGCMENATRPIPSLLGLCVNNVEICMSGKWLNSTGNYKKTNEICDNKDNDCDGLIDENLTQLTLNQNGSCKNNRQYCANGSWTNNLSNYIPSVEVCDSKDNNCNGLIDDGIGCSLKINSPIVKAYGEKKIFLNFTTDTIVDEIDYADFASTKPVWRVLCRNCSSYGNNTIKSVLFSDGKHNLSVRWFDNNMTRNTSVNFTVDTIDPILKSLVPKSGYTNSSFQLSYAERNIKTITFYYENKSIGKRNFTMNLNACIILKNVSYCNFTINLGNYNNNRTDFWLNITDIAENYESSRRVRLIVDTIKPAILNQSKMYNISGRYVNFNITIIDKNFASVTYLDHNDTLPKWKNLCTALKNGNCIHRLLLKPGIHPIDLKIVDKAANLMMKSINIAII